MWVGGQVRIKLILYSRPAFDLLLSSPLVSNHDINNNSSASQFSVKWQSVLRYNLLLKRVSF